jgi:hypothetical protein
MAADDLKSAYELALERLKQRDRDEGIEESAPLGRAQKEAIARLRREAEAKLAELEILHAKTVAAAAREQPDKLQEIEEHYRIDRARVESKLASDVSRVRRGGS